MQGRYARAAQLPPIMPESLNTLLVGSVGSATIPLCARFDAFASLSQARGQVLIG